MLLFCHRPPLPASRTGIILFVEILSGSIERITYFNSENGYTVFKLVPEDAQGPAEDRQGLVTVTGNLPELSPGEYLKMHGEWVDHPKHGRQFKIETIEQAYPATLEGVKRYLGSGLIIGIGPKIAERIVELLSNPRGRTTLASQGRRHIRGHFAFAAQAEAYGELLSKLHVFGGGEGADIPSNGVRAKVDQ